MDKAPDAFRTISEVADDLDLPQHVLRFWETRFSQIKPMKRGGGRRYYRPDDVDLLRGIRHLLYGEGYTIRGVQRILKDHGVKFVQSVWKEGAPQPSKASGGVEPTESGPGESMRAAPAGGNPPGGAEREPGLLDALLPQFLGRANEAAGDIARSEPQFGPRPGPPVIQAAVATSARAPQNQAAPSRPASQAAPAEREGEATCRDLLPREDLRRLQAALYELNECRRLVEQALSVEK